MKKLRLALRNLIESQDLVSRLLEADNKPLSDEGMKKMIPLFVKGTTENETHDCGHCSMFIPSAQKCTIVAGVIKSNGTCMYQDPSDEHATLEDEHDVKMSKDEAQYAEMPKGLPINCGTCRYFDDDYCRLWMGSVKENDCCISHDSPHYEKSEDADDA